ncbi:MAG: ABC transporter ATP-binding protein [Akkermansiaceae bacterium]|nr:ABC transporter ATP-binding protein [Armatimonadota bacterium]
MNLLVRFLRELRPYIKICVGIALVTLANSVLSLQAPSLVRVLFNALDPVNPRPINLPLFFAQMVGIALGIGILTFTMGVGVVWLSQQFSYNIRRKLYGHLQHLSQGFFEKAQTGKLVATVVNDVGQVNQLLQGGFTTIIQDTVILFGAVGIMFFQNWKLTLLALSVYPVYVVNYYLTRKALADNASKISELRGVIFSDLQEKLAGVQVVKSYAQERSEVRQYTHLNRDNFDLNVKQNTLGTLLFVRAELISAVGTAIILCAGGYAVMQKQFGQGDLVQFLLLATGFVYAPTVRLIQMNDQLARTQTGLRRIFEILDTPPAVTDIPNAPALPAIQGHVRYENVRFAYEPGQWVIKGFNLEVNPGEMIAFVGGSGSGKTTLTNLLLRHYDVTEGKLTVDGFDVREVQLHSLRRQIGVVLQESILFHATVRENLRYGKLDATDEEVEAAARAANIHHVITALPQGYDTKIGEDGMKLSVGEKQRMAIGRALLADPRILVLDEATSSLDSETETLIQDALDTLLRGRTSFVIAHRLSTIIKADKIVVMEKGEVVEMGNHAELLAKGGVYARLYAEQFRVELTASAAREYSNGVSAGKVEAVLTR